MEAPEAEPAAEPMSAAAKASEIVAAMAAPAAAAQKTAEAAKAAAVEIADGTILLFKTPTCPNCKAAMALLDKAGVNYETLNANEEKELVEKYGIKQAPTLVIPNDEGFERYRGVSDIKGWIKSR
jgi:ribonucleoside-triphosphate reductase